MQERRPIVIPQAHVPILHPCVWYDDCDGTLAYSISADGSDYVAQYSTSAPYVGTNGLRLKTRTTGATSGDKVTLSKWLPLPPTKLLRLRAMTMQPSASPDCFIYLYFYFYDGTNLNAAEIMLKTSDELVYYAATFRADYTSTALPFTQDSNVWNYIDLSVDLPSLTYHTLRVNDLSLDMSSISLASAASATPSQLRFLIEVETAAAAAAENYFDQIIVTAENP